jgi:butyryl-CoA dehydrogenase
MEQYVRDVRITQIYDGTNGIQALDLVRRKLNDGRLTRRFIEPTRAFLQEVAGVPGMGEFAQPTADAIVRLEEVAGWIVVAGTVDSEEAAAAATEVLRQFGLVALAGTWTRMAAVALPEAGRADGGFYSAKLATARFFMRHLLPQAEALAHSIMAGGGSVRDFDAAAF